MKSVLLGLLLMCATVAEAAPCWVTVRNTTFDVNKIERMEVDMSGVYVWYIHRRDFISTADEKAARALVKQIVRLSEACNVKS